MLSSSTPPRSHAPAQNRVSAEYHQIKWHVETGGRFGYEDFTEPDFIGAQSFSLLKRLQQACRAAPASAQFTFLTTYRIKDGDLLAALISGNDKALLVERLFDGTTDRSRMGKIRKRWREHLELEDDEQLRAVVRGLRVVDGHRSLQELRDQINFKAEAVGLLPCNAADSDFRYDELARQLKARRLNSLNREALLQFCKEERLLVERPTEPDPFLPIAIRSFLGPAADIVGAAPENTLLLSDDFRQRYLQEGREWQRDIRPKVESFLRAAVKKSAKLRLILDAHASIAFLAGAVLHLKSGVETQLVQKGRVGTRTWRVDDDSGARGGRFEIAEDQPGEGRDIAIAISVSQPATAQVRAYVAAQLPGVSKFISCAMPTGTRAAKCRRRRARRRARRSGIQSRARLEGKRSGRRHPYLCGRSEQPSVLSRSASSGDGTMHRLRVRFRPPGAQDLSTVVHYRLTVEYDSYSTRH